MAEACLTTTDLTVKFKRTARTFLRWQKNLNNPFPLPISQSKGADNIYSAQAIEDWIARGGVNAHAVTSSE